VRKPFPFFFEQAAAKKNQKTPKRGFRSLRRATRALPVDFWMLNFAEIQHRVASLTLEKYNDIHTPQCLSEKGSIQTFILWE